MTRSCFFRYGIIHFTASLFFWREVIHFAALLLFLPRGFFSPPGYSYAAIVYFAGRVFFCRQDFHFFCRKLGFSYHRETFLLSKCFFFFCGGFLLPPRFSCPLLGARVSFSSRGYKFCREVFHSAMRLSFFARRLFLLSKGFCFFVSFPDYGSCLYTKTIKAKILWGCLVLRFKVLQITCKIPLGLKLTSTK